MTLLQNNTNNITITCMNRMTTVTMLLTTVIMNHSIKVKIMNTYKQRIHTQLVQYHRNR